MQKAKGKAGEEWTGVRNFQARNNMRAMKLGDQGFFYHSGEEKAIVGIVEVVEAGAPGFDRKEDAWECVDIRAVEDVPKPVTLDRDQGRQAARRHGAGQQFAALGPAGDGGGMEDHLRPGRREGVNASSSIDRRFILANTSVLAPPLVPEIVLHLAHEAVPIWQKTEEELGEIGLPPPFWAFAWAGGQALARYVLDHPEIVRGRRVIDLASGSGLVAIAAMKAGAARVLAADIDRFAVTAMAINAELNGVAMAVTATICSKRSRPSADVILVGDLFYEAGVAARCFDWLQKAEARGIQCLIGDPLRSYLPRRGIEKIAEYVVPVTRDLEDADIKRTAVWRLSRNCCHP